MQKLFETYEACASNRDYTEPPQVEDGGKEAPALMKKCRRACCIIARRGCLPAICAVTWTPIHPL